MMSETPKSMVASGTHAGRSAVMKLAVSDNRNWLTWLKRERSFYRVEKDRPGDIKIPELLAEGSNPPFLVMTALDGEPLSADRLMTHVDPCLVSKLAQTARQLSTWQTSRSDQIDGQATLQARSIRYFQTGHLTDENVKSISHLVGQAAAQLRFDHGDLVGTNVIMGTDGEMALKDWEHSGPQISGYDLSVVWAMCELSPAGKKALLSHLLEHGEPEVCGFLANLLVTYAREKANYLDARLSIASRLVANISVSISRLQAIVDRGPPYRADLTALL